MVRKAILYKDRIIVKRLRYISFFFCNKFQGFLTVWSFSQRAEKIIL